MQHRMEQHALARAADSVLVKAIRPAEAPYSRMQRRAETRRNAGRLAFCTRRGHVPSEKASVRTPQGGLS